MSNYTDNFDELLVELLLDKRETKHVTTRGGKAPPASVAILSRSVFQ